VTTVEGTALVQLSPGTYVVESDEPVAFQGKSYRWRQTLDIVAGRVSALDLTVATAVVEPIAPGTTDADSPPATDTSLNAAAMGSTALSSCGRRPPTHRDSWSTRPD
jgi:hypothetical protein